MSRRQNRRLHLAAPVGAINDPNGMWADTGGRVHVVYQHNPAGESPLSAGIGSGPKYWGHAWSDDMVAWTHGASVIAPTPGWHDCDGAWSGSIVVEDISVQAFYSGVRFQGDSWLESVCSATINGAATVDSSASDAKRLLIAAGDAGNGNHFRDPYVAFHDGKAIMIVGGGTAEGGRLMAYSSSDLVGWEPQGVFFDASRASSLLPHDLAEAVWECPQLLMLNNAEVLIFSVDREPRPVVYLVGSADPEYGFSAENWGYVDCAFGSYATHAAELGDEGPCSISWVRGPSLSTQRSIDRGHLTMIRRLELDDRRRLLARFARSPRQVAMAVGMRPRRFEGDISFSGMKTALLEAALSTDHGPTGARLAELTIGSPLEWIRLTIDLRHRQAALRTPHHEMTLDVQSPEVELEVVWDAPIVEVIAGGNSLTHHFLADDDDVTLSLEHSPGVQAAGVVAVDTEEHESPMRSYPRHAIRDSNNKQSPR